MIYFTIVTILFAYLSLFFGLRYSDISRELEYDWTLLGEQKEKLKKQKKIFFKLNLLSHVITFCLLIILINFF